MSWPARVQLFRRRSQLQGRLEVNAYHAASNKNYLHVNKGLARIPSHLGIGQ